jgi:predicted N-formylglutamate amidohydrolase
MTGEFKPVELIDGDQRKGLVILCDHAANTLPPQYSHLGLKPDQLERHIAYDIGARGVAIGIAHRLGVPAVLSTFSRLLVDPNRGEDDPTVIMKIADGAIVGGNRDITPVEIERRLALYYRPYHDAVTAAINDVFAAGIIPAIFSVHSFTPAWRGRQRPWQVALLWDRDPRFVHALMGELRSDGNMVVGDNEPYDGALKNDTLYRHGTARGLAHALIEVRQDLIAAERGISEWVDRLAPILLRVNGLAHLHEISHFGSRTGEVIQQTNPEIGNRGAGDD